ncbi:MAG: MFS transporter [Gammaproteobacteria bacterium]|nr:MFS transporter [Gammaproteobacteria bacterium]
MKGWKDRATAEADRVSFPRMIAYGLGGFTNNLLAAASGGMMVVLNLGYGMNPALVGLLSAIPRFTDAATDPVMGYISDNTRSRWGRRRPFIFVGAILAGLFFAALWQLPRDAGEGLLFALFLAGSLLFFLAYTVFATPWVALGYELTPDYHERTRLMGVQNFFSQFAYLIAPWFLWFMELDSFTDIREGASALAVLVGIACIAVGVLPAILLRERFRNTAAGPLETASRLKRISAEVRRFLAGFVQSLRSRPFLKLCGATFLVFNGFQLIAAFQSYVIIFYIFEGDIGAAGYYIGLFGTIATISTFAVVAIAAWLGTAIGKRHAFFVCIGISTLGYGLKWFCYDPANPVLLLLPAPLLAFGLGSLFTLMPSMVADVCDLDELETGERREGMYGAIFWWVVKLGMAAALAAGGFLLNFTGFDVSLEGNQTESALFWMRVCDVVIPVITSLLAIALVASYDLSESKAKEIRDQLGR